MQKTLTNVDSVASVTIGKLSMLNTLKITVITIIANIYNILVDIKKAVTSIPINDIFVIGVLQDNGGERISRGYTGSKMNKTFPRCLYLYLCPEPTKPNQTVVVKVYGNGKLHITGAKTVEIGNLISQRLGELFNTVEIDGITKIDKEEDVTGGICEVLMINGGTSLGYEIDKNKLVEVCETIGIRSQEEGSSPARKIIWFWNLVKQKIPGVCNCTKSCSIGKGSGVGDGECNRCVVSILHSGVLQFMGSKYERQLYDIFQQIMTLISENKEHIMRHHCPATNKKIMNTLQRIPTISF